MGDWWNVVASVAKASAWAGYLSVACLLMSAGLAVFSFKAKARVAELQNPVAKAAMPAAQSKPEPAAHAPAEPARPGAKKAESPAVPAAAPAAPKPAAAAAAPEPPKVAPRQLSAAAKAKLSGLLSGNPQGQVSITYVLNDPESKAFSVELGAILTGAGWKVGTVSPVAETSSLKGLHFQIKNVQAEPENAKYIIHAFIEAGLNPVTELNKTMPEFTLLLIVGRKP